MLFEILLFREKNGIKIGLRLLPLQKSLVFEPFDVGEIAQRRESEDL
jgi:hypothetical protein